MTPCRAELSPLFQLAFQFWYERQRFGVGIVQVEYNQGRFFFAICLHPLGEFLLVLDELHLDVHLLARRLDLTQKEEVLDKGEDARSRILTRSGKGLRINDRECRRKTGPTRPSSLVAIAVIHAQVGAVAVIHGSGKNTLMLLAFAAHWAIGASFRRPPSTAPFVSSSACGGMSGSCIHIFLLLIVEINPQKLSPRSSRVWITDPVVSYSRAVGRLAGNLIGSQTCSALPSTLRLLTTKSANDTKPHIGWMLFENDAKAIDIQTVVVQT